MEIESNYRYKKQLKKEESISLLKLYFKLNEKDRVKIKKIINCFIKE